MKKLNVLFILVAILSIFSLIGCDKKETADETTMENTGDEVVVLTLATDATWPPMEYKNEAGDLVGFDIDMINAIADAAGFVVDIKNTAWDGIFAGLGNGAYDAVISSVTITDERKETMDFSSPYVNCGQVLVVRTEDAKNIETLADLVGKTAGAQIGTTGAMEIEKAEAVSGKEYDELGFAIEDLINGNIEGVVCDSPIAADFVLTNGAYVGKLKIVGEPFTEELYGIAVKKGNADSLALINKGLKIVIESGKQEELIDKWLR